MPKKQSLIFLLLILMSVHSSFSQTTLNVLWDKVENKPIPFATIKAMKNYSVSNDDGVFEFDKMNGEISIQSVAYETLKIDYNYLTKNDTIYLKPLTYELDEVVISKGGLYTQMLKKVLTDYALEPHKEEFFLRALIRRDSELYKIIDLSGKVERQSLFDTRAKPMPKKNYKVQIENMRKAGFKGKNYDVILFGFKEFFTYLIRLSFNQNDFDITYESTNSKDSRKITLEPKVKGKAFYKGYYILNEDNTFKEANVTFVNNHLDYKGNSKMKYRTLKINWKSNFEKNKRTGKLQLNRGRLEAKLEVKANEKKEIYDITYLYSSNPINNDVKIKNNINLKKDMFKLKKKYNPNYWKNHHILTLTNEMQTFINKVNSSENNPEFKTKSNMK